MSAMHSKKAYLIQSRGRLKNTFAYISEAAIEYIFNERSNLNFTEAYRQLSLIDINEDNVIEGAPNFLVRRFYPRRAVKISIVDDTLTDEISLIPELIQKPRSKPKEVIVLSDSEDDEDDAKPSAAAVSRDVVELLDSDSDLDKEQKDNLIECKVCYGDYEARDMCDCGKDRDHVVCKICICRFVSEQLLGNGSLKFKCIGNVGCDCEYPLALLEKVLPDDLNRQINEKSYFDIAQIEGMWQCPVGCGYVGFIEQLVPWVECAICNKQYCTMCNEPTHDGKTCEEVRLEKERLKNPRHRAHEAMSRAFKRFCPHCNQEVSVV